MSASSIEIISRIPDFEKLEVMRNNILAKDAMEPGIEAALITRFSELGRLLISERTGLEVYDLSPAEEKIVAAVAQYVGLLRSEGKYASRTFQMLANRGLIETAEVSVCKTQPALGFDILEQSNVEAMSFEQIVVDHPDEFSPRANWYARKALGRPNNSEKPPAASTLPTQIWTETILEWLRARAIENNGDLSGYSNADIGNIVQMDELSTYGRVLGNITSRIDFACYKCGLPPLGLVADQPFSKAWDQQNREWAFPIENMKNAAQNRSWTIKDLDQISTVTRELPGQASIPWKKELVESERLVREWALNLEDRVERATNAVTSTAETSTSEIERIAQLELDAIHQTPKQKIRTSHVIERGPIGNAVKKANEFKCQLCEALGDPVHSFFKKNGVPYVEAHHVVPVSERQVGALSATNIMTLCANHHRQMHYGNVHVEIREKNFLICLDDRVFEIKRTAIN